MENATPLVRMLVYFCLICGAVILLALFIWTYYFRGPLDTDGRTPADVFELFLAAVEADDYEKARTYWDGQPNVTNAVGRGKFSDFCDWWDSFSEVRILYTSKGKVQYYHVHTECYKGSRKVARPAPACFKDVDGRWKFTQ